MAGFTNDGTDGIVYADNVDFSAGFPQTGKVTTNAQLLIGSTAAPRIRVGTLTSPNGSVTIGYSAPDITLQVAASNDAILTLTPNEDFDGTAATPISPQAGNVNVFGSTLAAATVTETYNSTGAATGDLLVEHRAWLTPFVVDPSTTVGARGTFSTIAAALTAAVSGQTIFIRPGSYTENLTLKAGVNLCAFLCDAYTPNVTIIGTCTMTASGTVTISGIRLQTNSSFLLAVTGTNPSIVNLVNCYLNCTNNTGITDTSSGLSSIRLYNCNGNLGTTGITLFVSTSNGTIYLYECNITNSGNSTTASSKDGNAIYMYYTNFEPLLSLTSSGAAYLFYTSVNMGPLDTAILNNTGISKTGSVGISVKNSRVGGGSATAITLGSGTTSYLSDSLISSSNASTISGAGTVFTGGLTYSNTSLNAVTTQNVYTRNNDRVVIKSPGSYPYVPLAQDSVILVDTSSARSITPAASPIRGQMHRIKDSVGSAAANNITITPSSATIDGAASFVININYGSVDIVSDGANWFIL